MPSAQLKATDSCPSRDQLSSLIADELPAGPRAILEDHLASCAHCQSVLLELAGTLDLTPLTDSTPETDQREGSRETAHASFEPRSGFLQKIRPPTGLPCAAVFADSSTTSVDAIHLPGLELIDQLGRGGLGVVYLAWQQSLCRLVAVKVVAKQWLTTPEQRERALRGAAAVVRLQHPNIVQVYHLGQHQDWLYGILEYLEGGTLAERLTDAPWKPVEAAALLRTLALAVGFVHDNGLIHRDIKPANILFKADGTPKLADFGLARSVASNGRLTLEGEALGTPRFMSPEQARGDGTIGPPLDIHALGAVLYELLTGKPAFQGATKFEILYQIVHQSVAPPDQIQPNIPPELVRICMKCLEKDPAKRYASGAELAKELDGFLEGKKQIEVPQAMEIKSSKTALPWRRIAVTTLAIAIVEVLVIIWLVAERFTTK